MEARIRNSDSFQQRMKSLHEAAKAFTRDCVKSDECWKAFDRLDDSEAPPEERAKKLTEYGET